MTTRPRPQIHPAGPDARVITLPPGSRFTTAGVTVTTITISRSTYRPAAPPAVSLQGETTPPAGQEAAEEEEFIDLTPFMSSADAVARITLDAGAATRAAFEQALAELRHPAGTAGGTVTVLADRRRRRAAVPAPAAAGILRPENGPVAW